MVLLMMLLSNKNLKNIITHELAYGNYYASSKFDYVLRRTAKGYMVEVYLNDVMILEQHKRTLPAAIRRAERKEMYDL